MAAENYEKQFRNGTSSRGRICKPSKDPGGETNMGVTKRVYDEWCLTEDLAPKDMKELTFEDVAPIYRKNYWDRVKGDNLPVGLDLCIFDFGVNAGVGRAAKFIQSIIGTTVDGGIGPNTLGALEAYIAIEGLEATIDQYQTKDKSTTKA